MDNQNISLEVAPGQPKNRISWLANKAKVNGEYLVVSEPGELTGSNHCEYHNIGEALFRIGTEIEELIEQI